MLLGEITLGISVGAVKMPVRGIQRHFAGPYSATAYLLIAIVAAAGSGLHRMKLSHAAWIEMLPEPSVFNVRTAL
jgi:hypothetical protein